MTGNENKLHFEGEEQRTEEESFVIKQEPQSDEEWNGPVLMETSKSTLVVLCSF